MTRKLEEAFDLEHIDNFGELDDIDDSDEMSHKELMDSSQEILESLSNAEKIDTALTAVSEINEHDTEMDKIASKAMKAFDDLCALGMNMTDGHAGKIFEVAGQMLKTSLDAKDSKVTRKLKTVELQLKKAKIDNDDNKSSGSGSGEHDTNNEFDRNELLGYITDNTDV